MLRKGVFAASLSIINDDLTLNIESTIKHAENLIKGGLHGVFFFGSTGQSQLISISEKKNLISKISTHKLRKNFFIGTGCNSINENLDLIKYCIEYGFDTFLVMPPAYYKNNSDEGVFKFYEILIENNPKAKIILYNFEKLSGYLFSVEIVKKLNENFPKSIIGIKDSSYNIYEKLKLPNFLVFPGSEKYLYKGLSNGSDGCISATANLTYALSRKVFDDFEKKIEQTVNDKLMQVRSVFDKFNLIPAIHAVYEIDNQEYGNLIPPLKKLQNPEKIELIDALKDLEFLMKKRAA